MKIKENKTDQANLNFNPITINFVDKRINKLNSKKATGIDGISSKLIKLAKHTVSPYLTNIINQSFLSSEFPDELK